MIPLRAVAGCVGHNEIVESVIGVAAPRYEVIRLEQLRADLASGEWQRKYGDLLDKTELDLGYQLIVAGV